MEIWLILQNYNLNFNWKVRKNMKVIKTKDRTPQLIDKLLDVWENSVRATHHFLSNEEILEIKKYVKCVLENQLIIKMFQSF